MTDKCAVFIACLVCLLTGNALAGEAGGAALLSAPGVAMMLLAISAAALEHALPARLRAVAPIAYGVVALAAQPGLYFMPLALYDAMREIHEPGVVRGAPGIVAGLLAGLAPAAFVRSPRPRFMRARRAARPAHQPPARAARHLQPHTR